jgi:hypothetical protein
VIFIKDKYTGLTLGILVLVVLISGCVTGSTNASFESVDMTNNTYSGDGVSFDIPSNWKVSKIVDESNTNINIDKDSSNENTRITVVVSPNPKELSYPDLVNMIQNPTNPGGYQKISNSTMNVVGHTAYENIYIVNDSSIFNETLKEEDINFIINGYTYSLVFRAPENSFENEKSNFDITLKSFKVI